MFPAALHFYEGVFGFGHDEMPMPQGTYYVLKRGDTRRAGIMKAMSAAQPAMWMQYITVDDCDASLVRAQSLGATPFVPATDIPGIGRFAIFADPLGAVLGIIKPLPMSA